MVVLLTFGIRTHILRRHQPCLVPKRLQLAAEILHVRDDQGDELFVVPFTSCSARLNPCKRNGLSHPRKILPPVASTKREPNSLLVSVAFIALKVKPRPPPVRLVSL